MEQTPAFRTKEEPFQPAQIFLAKSRGWEVKISKFRMSRRQKRTLKKPFKRLCALRQRKTKTKTWARSYPAEA